LLVPAFEQTATFQQQIPRFLMNKPPITSAREE
jgi:hypothetical protein